MCEVAHESNSAIFLFFGKGVLTTLYHLDAYTDYDARYVKQCRFVQESRKQIFTSWRHQNIDFVGIFDSIRARHSLFFNF